jgi:hypothetical protein
MTGCSVCMFLIDLSSLSLVFFMVVFCLTIPRVLLISIYCWFPALSVVETSIPQATFCPAHKMPFSYLVNLGISVIFSYNLHIFLGRCWKTILIYESGNFVGILDGKAPLINNQVYSFTLIVQILSQRHHLTNVGHLIAFKNSISRYKI